MFQSGSDTSLSDEEDFIDKRGRVRDNRKRLPEFTKKGGFEKYSLSLTDHLDIVLSGFVFHQFEITSTLSSVMKIYQSLLLFIAHSITLIPRLDFSVCPHPAFSIHRTI